MIHDPHNLRADRMPDILTAPECAAYLRLLDDADGHPRDVADAVRSLDRLISDHGLPCIRIGKQRRFVTAHVRAWLDAQQQAAQGDGMPYPVSGGQRPENRTGGIVAAPKAA